MNQEKVNETKRNQQQIKLKKKINRCLFHFTLSTSKPLSQFKFGMKYNIMRCMKNVMHESNSKISVRSIKKSFIFLGICIETILYVNNNIV